METLLINFSRHFSRHRAKNVFFFFAKLTSAVLIVSSLSGCLLTSPYWNQVFTNHTDQVPIQAWSTSSNPVTIECSQAYHGGLYPVWDPVWYPVTTINPDMPGSYDNNGSRIYSVAWKDSLPSSCWRQDPGNGIWYSAVRAVQGSTEYSTFDLAGLECLGRENGAAGSWFGYLGDGCTKTYSNSSNNIPYVIFRANN